MDNKIITIKAAFADEIESIIHYKNYDSSSNNTKEIYLYDDEHSKEKFIEYFKSCSNFYIEDNYICFTVSKTKEELEEQERDRVNSLNYCILKLKKWFNFSEDNKNQIEIYLKHKKLNWILNEIKQ